MRDLFLILVRVNVNILRLKLLVPLDSQIFLDVLVLNNQVHLMPIMVPGVELDITLPTKVLLAVDALEYARFE